MARSRFSRELPSAVQPLSAAELRQRGVTRGRLQGPNWRRTSHGFYVPRAKGASSDSPTQRILDAQPLIPRDGALTGWAAAFLYGVDVLDGLNSAAMASTPLVISCPRHPGANAAGHIRFLRGWLPPEEVRLVHGIRVVSPLRAAFDGARLATSLEAAVVFVDACAHAAMIDLAELQTYASIHPGRTGVRQAARAIALGDPAARSPGESRLRVCYLLEARLPRPQVNLPIFDLHERLLGIADLFDEEAGFVTEYDGSLHRERVQHNADNVREELFERVGLVVVRADSMDLTTGRAALVQRLRAGYRDGLARDRRRDRWTLVEPPWWIEQQDPMQHLTSEQKAALFAGM